MEIWQKSLIRQIRCQKKRSGNWAGKPIDELRKRTAGNILRNCMKMFSRENHEG